ncbi:MAG: hypothetical protein ACKERG_01025 [Candidatus Hodgkinia cicadicola]
MGVNNKLTPQQRRRLAVKFSRWAGLHVKLLVEVMFIRVYSSVRPLLAWKLLCVLGLLCFDELMAGVRCAHLEARRLLDDSSSMQFHDNVVRLHIAKSEYKAEWKGSWKADEADGTKWRWCWIVGT